MFCCCPIRPEGCRGGEQGRDALEKRWTRHHPLPGDLFPQTSAGSPCDAATLSLTLRYSVKLAGQFSWLGKMVFNSSA